ncbi:hypothetical protein EV127DRAFT_426955 [Xylaria flabelliformis]|nr:hypothetical protein EV127DRAFT_426955 [Xylaria flabelliformis]
MATLTLATAITFHGLQPGPQPFHSIQPHPRCVNSAVVVLAGTPPLLFICSSNGSELRMLLCSLRLGRKGPKIANLCAIEFLRRRRRRRQHQRNPGSTGGKHCGCWAYNCSSYTRLISGMEPKLDDVLLSQSVMNYPRFWNGFSCRRARHAG